MMGNHIIKAARCALLPVLLNIKTAASHGIQKIKRKGENKSETDSKLSCRTGPTQFKINTLKKSCEFLASDTCFFFYKI